MLKTMIASAADFVSAPGAARRVLHGLAAVRREAVSLLNRNQVLGPLVAMLPLSVLLSALSAGPRGAYDELTAATIVAQQGRSFLIGCLVFAVVGVLAAATRADRAAGRAAGPGAAAVRSDAGRWAGVVAWAGVVWIDGFLAAVLSAVAPLGPGGALPSDIMWILAMAAVGTASGWTAIAVIAFSIGLMLRRRWLAVTASIVFLVVLPVVVDVVFWPSRVAEILPMSAARAVAAPGIAEHPAQDAVVLCAWVAAFLLLAWGARHRRAAVERSVG